VPLCCCSDEQRRPAAVPWSRVAVPPGLPTFLSQLLWSLSKLWLVLISSLRDSVNWSHYSSASCIVTGSSDWSLKAHFLIA
jgi:hypothetical protein